MPVFFDGNFSGVSVIKCLFVSGLFHLKLWGLGDIQRFVMSSHLGWFDMATCPKILLLVICQPFWPEILMALLWKDKDCWDNPMKKRVETPPNYNKNPTNHPRSSCRRLKAWNSHPSPSRSSSRPMTSEVWWGRSGKAFSKHVKAILHSIHPIESQCEFGEV